MSSINKNTKFYISKQLIEKEKTLVAIIFAVGFIGMSSLYVVDHQVELQSVNNIQDFVAVVRNGEFINDYDYPGKNLVSEE